MLIPNQHYQFSLGLIRPDQRCLSPWWRHTCIGDSFMLGLTFECWWIAKTRRKTKIWLLKISPKNNSGPEATTPEEHESMRWDPDQGCEEILHATSSGFDISISGTYSAWRPCQDGRGQEALLFLALRPAVCVNRILNRKYESSMSEGNGVVTVCVCTISYIKMTHTSEHAAAQGHQSLT